MAAAGTGRFFLQISRNVLIFLQLYHARLWCLSFVSGAGFPARNATEE